MFRHHPGGGRCFSGEGRHDINSSVEEDDDSSAQVTSVEARTCRESTDGSSARSLAPHQGSARLLKLLQAAVS